MNAIKKKDLFKDLFKKTQFITCPICGTKLNLDNESLVCENNHTFNINKKGYVSLLKKQKKFDSTIYTKELFENRRKAILSGLYSEVHNEIADFVNSSLNNDVNIFEIGSGEATHSDLIKTKIHKSNNYVVSDLASVSIDLATEYLNDGLLPLLCDAYNLPIASNSIDYVIDILSPYYYKEINRVLKKDGYFIKVFPEKEYLKEIRDLVNMNEYTKQDEVFLNFCKYYNVIHEKTIKLTTKISSDLAYCIFKMTPMTNNRSADICLNKITINLKIVFAQKK